MKKQLYALDDQAVLPINRYHDHQKSNPKFAILRGAVTVLTILTLIPLLYHPSLSYHSNLLLSNRSSPLPSSSSSSSSALSISASSPSFPDFVIISSSSPSSIQDDVVHNSVSNVESNDKCDLFAGKWVWEPEIAPYYTNTTCTAIHEHQNCMKYGKPDLDFTKWRWSPDECVLPLFDPEKFLEIVWALLEIQLQEIKCNP